MRVSDVVPPQYAVCGMRGSLTVWWGILIRHDMMVEARDEVRCQSKSKTVPEVREWTGFKWFLAKVLSGSQCGAVRGCGDARVQPCGDIYRRTGFSRMT